MTMERRDRDREYGMQSRKSVKFLMLTAGCLLLWFLSTRKVIPLPGIVLRNVFFQCKERTQYRSAGAEEYLVEFFSKWGGKTESFFTKI